MFGHTRLCLYIRITYFWGKVKISFQGYQRTKISMTNAFDIVDKINGKRRDIGAVVCMYDSVQWLNERTVALPVEYIQVHG